MAKFLNTACVVLVFLMLSSLLALHEGKYQKCFLPPSFIQFRNEKKQLCMFMYIFLPQPSFRLEIKKMSNFVQYVHVHLPEIMHGKNFE